MARQVFGGERAGIVGVGAYRYGRTRYLHLICSLTMGSTSGYIHGTLSLALPRVSDGAEWMQNLECVTPSCTHRTNSSGEGMSPPNPPTSAPVFCIKDMPELSWMCCEPRMLCQLVRLSPDQVEQAYLNAAGFPDLVKTKVRRRGAAVRSTSWLRLNHKSNGSFFFLFSVSLAST